MLGKLFRRNGGAEGKPALERLDFDVLEYSSPDYCYRLIEEKSKEAEGRRAALNAQVDAMISSGSIDEYSADLVILAYSALERLNEAALQKVLIEADAYKVQAKASSEAQMEAIARQLEEAKAADSYAGAFLDVRPCAGGKQLLGGSAGQTAERQDDGE